MSWTHQTLTEMQTEEPVRDVASVDSLQKRHEGMKSEIDAREELFASVVESGRAMIQAGHYDSNEVLEIKRVAYTGNIGLHMGPNNVCYVTRHFLVFPYVPMSLFIRP